MTKILNFLNTVFVKGFWQTFCMKWIHDAFWKTLVCKKLKFDKWKGWIYLFPAIVLLLIFTVWPIFNTVRISLLEGYGGLSAVGGKTFEFGFANFQKVIEYKGFLTCLKNTMLLCVLTVPLSTIFPSLYMSMLSTFSSAE